jgi:adenine/guanine phosphoribosyltransferase-like PRPP-binding protein
MSLVTSYLHPLFQPNVFISRVNNLVRMIKRSNIKFNAVAFRGMSGSIVAPVVAARLNKQMIMIRKSDDDSHSNLSVEGDTSVRSYIIIDDRIASGETVRTINRHLSEFTFNQAKLRGVFLYYHPGDDSEKDLQNMLKLNVPVRKLNNVYV